MPSTLAARATLAAASLALVLTGCNFKADFVITREFKAPANPVVANNGTYTKTLPVDLAADAPGAWKRRDDLKSLDLVAADATIDAIRAGAGVPVTGTLVLTRGAQVVTGTWSHTITAPAPDSFSITMPPEADALLMDAIRDDGKFTVTATATTTGSVDLDVTVRLHVGINYHIGP